MRSVPTLQHGAVGQLGEANTGQSAWYCDGILLANLGVVRIKALVSLLSGAWPSPAT